MKAIEIEIVQFYKAERNEFKFLLKSMLKQSKCVVILFKAKIL